MSPLSVPYPVTPVNIDQSVLDPSPAFKQEVFKVLGAITFFIFVYIVLVIAALGLAALCGFAGVSLIILKPMFLTLMLGLGMLGLGVMVVFFLFKFLFKRNKTDRSGLIEISEADQPALFEFIRTLTRETQTPFPKKIYLSPEVNASVFYDSSFWSMFLPVRKNLQIGLGLVNAINLSEFKAILAHEFGHFSQRSMKLGSYVYNVNQVIYNMLYDNEGYGRTLETWASASGYFAFFAGLTIKIVSGIQWILRQVYGVVNKQYMSLSRQMEFHADTVAAYVSGSDHLITSLRRLDVANTTYNNLFDYYNDHFKEGLKPENIYPQHTEIMKQFAAVHALPFINSLPQIDAQSFSKFNTTRVMIKDQWASHPSTDDREAHLRSLNIKTSALTVSAWTVFTNVDELQKRITDKIYETVTFEAKTQLISESQFAERYANHLDKYRLNPRYRGYFEQRNISAVNLRDINGVHVAENTLEEILDEKSLSLTYSIDGLKSDIQTLEAIKNKNLPVKNFEFNGQKYNADGASSLILQLQDELKATETQLRNTDERLIAFFLTAAQKHNEKENLRQRYSELFIVSEAAEADKKKYIDIMQDIMPIYHGNLQLDQVNQIMEKVKLHEVLIKDRLQQLINDPTCKETLTDANYNRVIEYLSKDFVYFSQEQFNQQALEVFNDTMNIYYNLFSDRNFKLQKELLETQLQFIE
jgi:Zn-dependent protease with chaperone function